MIRLSSFRRRSSYGGQAQARPERWPCAEQELAGPVYIFDNAPRRGLVKVSRIGRVDDEVRTSTGTMAMDFRGSTRSRP